MTIGARIELDGFTGNQYAAGDAGYDEARRVYNALIDKRPALIAQCRSTADIVAAVNCGRDRGLEISVRGGGHGVAGRSLTEGGLMIDLSRLKEIEVDAERKKVRVGAGAIWRELNEATQTHGLAVTGGVISTTGVAGLTLGGGLGWLMPKYGLALDNLVSAEVITADGRVLIASEELYPDLFWALRGGGGNFGVVRSFEYRLHDLGPTITGGLVAHPLDAAPALLRFFRDFTADAPDELMAVAGLVHAPDGSGARLGAVVVCHIGPPEQAERDLAPLLAFGTPALSQIGPIPYTAQNAMLDDGYPYGSLNYWKSSFMDELPDEAVDRLVEAYARCPAPLGGVILEHFHGQVTRIPLDATACELRRPGYNLGLTSVWIDPAATAACIAWTRETYAALQPFCSSLRYLNYYSQDDESDAALRAAYSANYERLTQVKRVYDPDNLFRLNLNVKPA